MIERLVLIMGKLPPPYIGPAIATKVLLNSEVWEGYSIIHLDTGSSGSLDDIGSSNIKKIRRLILSYVRLCRILFEKNLDLVLAPVSQSTFGFLKDSIYILLLIVTKTRYIVQVRGSEFGIWYGSRPYMLRIYIKFVVGNAAAGLVLSESLKNIFNGLICGSQVYVAPNGMDYALKNERALGAVMHVLTIANIVPRKGVEDVIVAISMLQKKYSRNIRYVCGGGWASSSFKSEIMEIIVTTGVDISLAGIVAGAKKDELLENSDIYIFAPRKPEGMPWSIIEAMAAGLPIITTDMGAISDCVVHNINGIIVLPGDPQAIANAVEYLYLNPVVRAEMGRESRKLYEQKYTEKSMIEAYIRCFDSILA